MDFAHNILSDLTFQWMKFTGPHLDSCCHIHSGLSHSGEILNKMARTTATSSKFYLFFHLLPFLLKLKKNLRQGKFSKACLKSLKNYMRSILFIAHLVGGLKLLLCSAVSLSSNFKMKIDGKVFLWATFVSSLGIFWEEGARREQITYFAFVRSIRSSYMFLKRRNLVSFKYQIQICFILLFGLLSYILTAFPQTVKRFYIVSKIWGDI